MRRGSGAADSAHLLPCDVDLSAVRCEFPSRGRRDIPGDHKLRDGSVRRSLSPCAAGRGWSIRAAPGSATSSTPAIAAKKSATPVGSAPVQPRNMICTGGGDDDQAGDDGRPGKAAGAGASTRMWSAFSAATACGLGKSPTTRLPRPARRRPRRKLNRPRSGLRGEQHPGLQVQPGRWRVVGWGQVEHEVAHAADVCWM